MAKNSAVCLNKQILLAYQLEIGILRHYLKPRLDHTKERPIYSAISMVFSKSDSMIA
jgi:hypothetical protein